jgi:hypothetical protein
VAQIPHPWEPIEQPRPEPYVPVPYVPVPYVPVPYVPVPYVPAPPAVPLPPPIAPPQEGGGADKVVAVLLMVLIIIGGCCLGAVLYFFQGAGPDQPAGPASQATTADAGGPTAEPRTAEAAKAAAQILFDRYSARDFGAVWDMYAARGKAAVSRADFVKLNQACPAWPAGLPINVTNAYMEGDRRALVVIKVGNLETDSYAMDYEDGHWLGEPSPEVLAEYAKGVDQAIADRKKVGGCG